MSSKHKVELPEKLKAQLRKVFMHNPPIDKPIADLHEVRHIARTLAEKLKQASIDPHDIEIKVNDVADHPLGVVISNPLPASVRPSGQKGYLLIEKDWRNAAVMDMALSLVRHMPDELIKVKDDD